MLADWLDNQGCLAISAHHYVDDVGGSPNSFMNDYLGVSSGSANHEYTQVTGVNSFSGLGPYNVNSPSDFRFSWLGAGANGELAFTDGATGTAVLSQTANFTSLYLGWPLEGLLDAQRHLVIGRIVDLCNLNGECRNEDDLAAHYPSWPQENSIDDLLNCLLNFR